MPEVLTACELAALEADLAALGAVQAVDVLDDDPTGRVVIEVTTIAGLERVPPAVVDALAAHDAGLGPIQPQGSAWKLEVRA